MAARDARAHRHFDTVGSTNRVALDWAREEATGEGIRWITADTQTAGRGRRAREWSSPRGNLYASAAIAADTGGIVANLPFRAALALRDAITALEPAVAEGLRLKWPNDLLLDGRKLSGILLEATNTGSASVVVIGFGVNCTVHPQNTGTKATDLRTAGYEITAPALYEALRVALACRLKASDEKVLNDWRQNARGIGEPIVVRLPDEEIEGTFEALADDGRLVLAGSDGSTRMIATGDVFFPNTQGNRMTDLNEGANASAFSGPNA